jgi:hypothetical protein
LKVHYPGVINACIRNIIIVISYYKYKFNLYFNAHMVCIIKKRGTKGKEEVGREV